MQLREKINGVEVQRFQALFRIGRFASFWTGFEAKLQNFDVIHIHNIRHPHVLLAIAAAKKFNKKIVITPHYPLYSQSRKPHMQLMADVFDNTILKQVLKKADKIIALHEIEKTWLESLGVVKEKIAVIPNGLPESYFKQKKCRKLKNKTPFILFLGRMHYSKGPDIALKAIENIDCNTIFAGPDAGMLEEIVKRAAEMKIGYKIKFLGKVSDDEKECLFQQCDIFIMPSRSEGFGISLIEAMAKGKPCIASNIGGIPEIISNNKNGMICNLNPTEFETSLKKLLSDKKLKEKISKNARQDAIKKYNWKILGEKIEKAYKSILKSP